jgi:hypothetical protein
MSAVSAGETDLFSAAMAVKPKPTRIAEVAMRRWRVDFMDLKRWLETINPKAAKSPEFFLRDFRSAGV